MSEESRALIKEKRRLSRQYSRAHDPLAKSHINQLQKEIKDNLGYNHRLVVAFLDVEKAFDNVWHNGLRYKISMLDLPSH